MLEQPERENRLGPSLGEPAHVERAVRAHAAHDRLDQFADIHRRDPRSHANPESRGVEPMGLDAGVFDRHRGRSHGEPHGPAHQLQVLLVFAQVGKNVEILDLAGDLDTQTRRVKTLDVIHAGPPFENGLAEFATTNPVRRDHADSGHDHAVHFVPHAHSLR